MVVLLKKIKLKLELMLTAFSLKASLILNWPWLTAVILALVTNQVNRTGEKTVLCMRRSIFMDDVRAMVEFSGRIHYLVLGRENLFQILSHFVGKSEMKQVTQHNYYSENYGQAGKEKYYQYLKKVWPIFKKFRKFDGVLYSNFCYTEQQELARACGELGIPLVVLFKEGMVTPGTHVDWALKAHQGFKYGKQAKMLVYNQEIKKAMAEIGVPGLTAEKMEVVGVPRMDYYFKTSSSQSSIKQVLFFSTDLLSKLVLLVNDKKDYQKVSDQFDYFHRMVMEFAKEHPDFEVVIKTKMYQPFLEYVLNIRDKNFKTNISNLEIVNVGKPEEMIKNSRVIIGFGSTALIEALAANKVIISFDFGGLLSDDSFDYFKNYPGLVNYVKTKEDLEKIILNFEEYSRRDQNLRANFLEEFLYIPDGNSSSRAEEEIIKTIQGFKEA